MDKTMPPRDQLYDLLMQSLAAHSGYEERRPYVGMSKAGDCPRRIYLDYLHGNPATPESHMGAFLGYTIERAVRQILGDALKPGREISAFGGLVKGHTDGEFDGQLLEIKSCTEKKILEILDDHRIPLRHLYQANAYMRYGGYRSALVIYLPRDYGLPMVWPLTYSQATGDALHGKFQAVVNAVQAAIPPRCDCRRCPEPMEASHGR